jgi:RimJ/RimL family protein N-acetyltransferase
MGVSTPEVFEMIDLVDSPVITTPRLQLRAPKVREAERIARLADDPGVGKMTSRMPYPYAVADAEGFLDRMAAADNAREQVFAIERPDAGLIGMIGFHPGDLGRTELGYWLGRPYWGCGYATESVNAALVWAREAWGRRMIVAGHFADNPASGEVLIKAGFLYTGEVQRRWATARSAIVPTRMMIWLA